MGSATPPPQVGGVRALPNLGVRFYLRVHPLTQNYTKFDVVTHMARGVFLGSQPRHCIALAQTRRAVCQQQQFFLQRSALGCVTCMFCYCVICEFFCCLQLSISDDYLLCDRFVFVQQNSRRIDYVHFA